MASLTRLSAFNSQVDSLLQGIDDNQISSADRDKAIRQAIAEYSRDLPKVRTLKILGNGSSYYLMCGKAVDIDESNIDAGIVLKTTGDDSKLAIKFTLDYPMEIYQIDFYLQRIGNTEAGTVAGSLSAKLMSLSSDLPDKVIATSASVDIDDVEGAPLGRYDAVHFVFANPYLLPAGSYAASLVPSGYTYASGTSEVLLGVVSGDGDDTVYTYDGVDTWAEYPSVTGVLEVIGGVRGWSAFSGAIESVEYPAANIASDETAQILENDEYEMFNTETGEYLHLLSVSPSTSDYLRITYNHPHSWTESASDPLIEIPGIHFEAVCNLASGIACNLLSVRYGQTIAASISADSVDRRNKSDVYSSRANDFRKMYRALVGLPEKSSGAMPGMTVVDNDLGPSVGRDFLFHTRGTR